MLRNNALRNDNVTLGTFDDLAFDLGGRLKWVRVDKIHLLGLKLFQRFSKDWRIC